MAPKRKDDPFALGPNIAAIRDGVALHNLTSAFQILLGLKHAAIALDDPRGRNVHLSTRQENFRQAQVARATEGQAQGNRSEPAPARTGTSAITDVATFDSQCRREFVPNIRYTDNLVVVLD